MNIVLLSGGSGKRLWPLSNDVRSKQFLKVFAKEDGTHESMAQRMYRMIKLVDPDACVMIATSINQIPQIKSQLGDSVEISVEPERRDTFPAIALAISLLKKKGHADDESVVVCPVDPYVDIDYFECLKELNEISCKPDAANITLMGIEPTYPSEKYGYIIPKHGTTISAVEEFKEKPSVEEAKKYIQRGALWNGGIFAFKISYILKLIDSIYGVKEYDQLYQEYGSLKKTSFDYEVVEKEESIDVIRFNGEWKDLGTWNTLSEAMADPVSGNVTANECYGTHIINELSVPLIALGIQNAVIAATPDGILVSKKELSPRLKDYVETSIPMYACRQWGEYRVLDYKTNTEGHVSLTKELIVHSGRKIDYHLHKYITETWTIIDGEGLLVVDDVITTVTSGNVIGFSPNIKHAILAKTELRMIEVQISKNTEEDDICQIEFDWNRL